MTKFSNRESDKSGSLNLVVHFPSEIYNLSFIVTYSYLSTAITQFDKCILLIWNQYCVFLRTKRISYNKSTFRCYLLELQFLNLIFYCRYLCLQYNQFQLNKIYRVEHLTDTFCYNSHKTSATVKLLNIFSFVINRELVINENHVFATFSNHQRSQLTNLHILLIDYLSFRLY